MIKVEKVIITIPAFASFTSTVKLSPFRIGSFEKRTDDLLHVAVATFPSSLRLTLLLYTLWNDMMTEMSVKLSVKQHLLISNTKLHVPCVYLWISPIQSYMYPVCISGSALYKVTCVKVQREALAESSVVFGRVFGNKVGRRLTV